MDFIILKNFKKLFKKIMQMTVKKIVNLNFVGLRLMMSFYIIPILTKLVQNTGMLILLLQRCE